jgi:hypothetical protein
MRNSLQDDTAARLSVPPALRSSAATVNGTGVDLAGTGNFFRTAMLVAIAGAVTDGTHTFVLQESDDNSSFTNVAAADLQGSLAVVASGGGTVSGPNTVQRQSYIGSKRYLRANVTTAGATTGAITAAVILLAQGSGQPVT